MHQVSEEGLNENTMLWELRFIGLMASKVGAAGRQQRIHMGLELQNSF